MIMHRKTKIGPDAALVAVRLPETQRAALTAAARAEGVTVSAVIRQALALRVAATTILQKETARHGTA
jgi:uncharacterized protein (DUF1778 family)